MALPERCLPGDQYAQTVSRLVHSTRSRREKKATGRGKLSASLLCCFHIVRATTILDRLGFLFAEHSIHELNKVATA